MSIDQLLGKIYCGDCLEFMRQLPDKCVDLVLTDPPYGVNRDKGFGGAGGFNGVGKKAIPRREYGDTWDADIPDVKVFQEIIRVSKNQMVFGGNFFAHILPRATHWIFWDKGMTMPSFGDGELIWTSFPRKSVKKEFFQYNGLMSDSEDERKHPTQKPSELIARLLRDYSLPTDIIFDPFMGVGTTGLAAEKEQRRWLGCEIKPEYVAIAHYNIAAEARQLKLF